MVICWIIAFSTYLKLVIPLQYLGFHFIIIVINLHNYNMCIISTEVQLQYLNLTLNHMKLNSLSVPKKGFLTYLH